MKELEDKIAELEGKIEGLALLNQNLIVLLVKSGLLTREQLGDLKTTTMKDIKEKVSN